MSAVWFETCSDARDGTFGKFASAAAQPFTAFWTPEREGHYRLRACAAFVGGGWRVSREIIVLAGAVPSMPPKGSILFPPRWATLVQETETRVDARVQDADGQVTGVVFSVIEAGPIGLPSRTRPGASRGCHSSAGLSRSPDAWLTTPA